MKKILTSCQSEYIGCYTSINGVVEHYFLFLYHTITVGYYRGEDSGAIYHDKEREVDFTFDVTNELNELVSGETIKKLFTKIQHDGAITVPVYRHKAIFNWLLSRENLLVTNNLPKELQGV